MKTEVQILGEMAEGNIGSVESKKITKLVRNRGKGGRGERERERERAKKKWRDQVGGDCDRDA